MNNLIAEQEIFQFPSAISESLVASTSSNDEILWNEARYAEMSGLDYVFISYEQAKLIRSPEQISEFVLKLPVVSGNEAKRCVLIGMSECGHYADLRYEIEWMEKAVRSVSLRSLQNSPQYDFIQTLYEHSEYFYF
ncbi:hypothetical protein [Teredinibacter sp. KSP-S5-2]|uniref:hypothetical protein n=1 Tax=Teredinibacter sp. KSP-S5-2 TaxID=3034506 RepID=UPI002934A690|nr:hypothetical protein [Teredinibacter sp. KSP-S5-2]WNO11387.1 hypothetical protein P5V12_09410 [Teredinibacter sp. KSP-S5-2]